MSQNLLELLLFAFCMLKSNKTTEHRKSKINEYIVCRNLEKT